MIGEDMEEEEDIAGPASHAQRLLSILRMHELLNLAGSDDESSEDS